MSYFVTQVKGFAAMGQTDINRISETVIIPLFSETFGYRTLRNLNFSERQNFPGIDLADDSARVAVQVTSTSTGEKVKETLRQFVDHQMFKKYDRLVIYILTEKQRSYASDTFRRIVESSFPFDPGKDIIDYRDLLNTIASFQINKACAVQNILEANFADGKTPLFLEDHEKLTEKVYLNLLEITFPDTLYIAELLTDDKPSPRKTRSRKKTAAPPRKPPTTAREKVQVALAELGLKFSMDWEAYGNQIITFHKLGDHSLPLSQIVDQGTVTTLIPEEFYGIDENYERVFKSFLSRCMQQKLYRRQVQWQNEEKLFIFCEVDGLPERVEKWRAGNREYTRTVFSRKMKNDKPDEILQCKHLAFRTQYKYYDNRWYVLIKPEWFFSRDGYRKDFFSSDSIDWLKKKERNSHLANHLSFIAHFLKYDNHPDLLKGDTFYPFLKFGSLASFDTAPALDDRSWNPPADKEDGDTLSGMDNPSLFEI